MAYTRTQKILIQCTQLFGQLAFKGIYPDEATSAYVYRKQYPRWIKFINWLMNDPNHCKDAYISEKVGRQNAPEYRD